MKKVIRERVWNKFDKRCAYCGCELEYKDMQVDHLHPKSRETEIDIHHIDNLMPSCRGCNFYKSSFTLEGFREQMLTLHERIQKPFINRLGIRYGIVHITPFSGVFYFEDEEQQYWDKY